VVPDYADGKGLEVADAQLDLIDASSPAWVAWPGRWGSRRARSALESNSPRGPAHQDKWRHPQIFHEECDEIRRDRGFAPPAPPQISARGKGSRA
jgi:hypothetical protein